MYLLALLCPPLAVLLSGRFFGAILCVPLTLMAWFPGALYAILVVSDRKATMRTEQLAKSIGLSMAGAITASQAANAKAMAAARGESTSLVDELIADRQAEQVRLNLRWKHQNRLDASERRAEFFAAVRGAPMRFMWAVDDARLATLRAYHSLPEWAQPVTWGLMAGTPIAVVATVLFLRR